MPKTGEAYDTGPRLVSGMQSTYTEASLAEPAPSAYSALRARVWLCQTSLKPTYIIVLRCVQNIINFSGAAGVTADTVPPEDVIRHGSITLANAVLPQRIRSAIADTIQL